MTNNDILKKLRYAFDFGDDKMISLFKNAGFETNRAEISDWLKKEEDEAYKPINDTKLAYFLNGFIVDRRGKKDGQEIVSEKSLNNNLILRKLKIALELKDEDLIEILKLVDFKVSKPELSAFFRNPEHKHFRPCKDQILRRILFGLETKYRKKED